MSVLVFEEFSVAIKVKKLCILAIICLVKHIYIVCLILGGKKGFGRGATERATERATPPPPLQAPRLGASATGCPQGRVRRGLGCRRRIPRPLPAEICRPTARFLRATERATARESPQPSLQDPRSDAAATGCLQGRVRRGLGSRSRISRNLPVDGRATNYRISFTSTQIRPPQR
jgi:hypothetical protein